MMTMADRDNEFAFDHGYADFMHGCDSAYETRSIPSRPDFCAWVHKLIRGKRIGVKVPLGDDRFLYAIHYIRGFCAAESDSHE
jgi:hypothetical protein